LKRQAKSHFDHADSTFYRFSGMDKLLVRSDSLGYFRGKVGSQLGLDLGQLILEENFDVPPSLDSIQLPLLLPARPVCVFEMTAQNLMELCLGFKQCRWK
jgi:hypothetical protein